MRTTAPALADGEPVGAPAGRVRAALEGVAAANALPAAEYLLRPAAWRAVYEALRGARR